MTVQAPTFSRGGDAAQAADEAARAASGGNFKKVHYLPKIGNGKQIVLRYITDSANEANPAMAWLYADAHPSAPTKNKPSDWPSDRKWPESMPATCRYDKNLAGIFSDCYICDAKLTNNWGRQCKPVVRVWAIAVIREEVIGTQEMVQQGVIQAEQVGKRVGFKDATREIDVVGEDGKATGEKKIEPALIVVNQAVSNYFGGLQSMYGVYGTVCDRDYIVKQTGEGKDTEYTHIPLDPTPNLKPGTEKWARYEKAIEEQGINLDQLVFDKANDEFFALFFDPNKQAPARGKKDDEKSGSNGEAPASQQNAAPSNEPDESRLAAMRDRVRGGSGAAAAPAEAQAAPAGAAAGSADFD